MSSDFRFQVQQLQSMEENKKCIDCNSLNPQVSSTYSNAVFHFYYFTYPSGLPFHSAHFSVLVSTTLKITGKLMVVECSGQHRSLGVHISFVRSVTMDAWKEDQLKKMKVGGNDKARAHFEKYGISNLPIREKYYTKAADLYRDKLSADVQGVPFDMPGPSPELAVPNIPQLTQSGNSGTVKARNESYFEKKGFENANRPENLPPSQGGKYVGFGNSGDFEPSRKQESTDIFNDAFSTFSKGFSIFTSKATEVAKIAAEQASNLGKELNDNVIKPTTQRLQDPSLRQNLQTSITQFGTTILDTTDKGISFLSNAVLGEDPSSSVYQQVGTDSPSQQPLAPNEEVPVESISTHTTNTLQDENIPSLINPVSSTQVINSKESALAPAQQVKPKSDWETGEDEWGSF